MKLYFLRHAEAEDIVSGSTDHDRKLTARGIERTRAAGTVLVALNLKPTHIYASPRVRARHTAEIIARALGVKVEIHDDVNYDFDVQAVAKLIGGLTDEHEVMFVGHEPSLSQVIGQLTGGNVVMKKGSLARVDVVLPTSPLRGQLIWLIAPKIFEALES